MGVTRNRFIVFFGLCAVVLCLWAGCKAGPAFIDAGDIERVRSDYQQLRSEYEKLQSDYKRLADENQYYLDYYRNATAAIESGLGELSNLGADSAGEIQKLRILITVLRNIVQSLIDLESGAGKRDSGFEGQDKQPE